LDASFLNHAFMTKFFSVTFLSILFALPVYGQFYSTQYRLPAQNWKEINTENFRLIYPARYEEQAIRSITILEGEYDDIQSLVGGNLRRFPIILNPGNDRSNGFVAPLNFRSEVELAPIKGKTLNPQSGDWLESVLPHELVHALHFSENPRSITSMLGLFSPDVRRSVHSAAPLGVFEGIAVEHESHGSLTNSGRGNYPYFTNRFTSMLDTPNKWSMGQLVHVTEFTLPFDRHYIGGYELTHWLQNTYGENTIKDAIRFHYRYPFLGFGTALRHTTGKWPGRLYKEFSKYAEEREAERLNEISSSTDTVSLKVEFDATCRRMNRPLWLDDESILFYARSCNIPAGFYVYNILSGEYSLLNEVLISEDHYYSLSADRSHLLYSRYHPDRRYDNVFQGDLHIAEIASGSSDRITRNQRLFSPEMSGNRLFALQTDAHTLSFVEVDPQSGSVIRNISKPENSSIFQIAANPLNSEFVAIAGKVKSVQGIWFEQVDETEILLNRDPDIVFHHGSVFDLHWNADGNRLLFASDDTGSLNVYEYDHDLASVTQLTDSKFNVFEPSYSPDGNFIAYIQQVGNEQILHIFNRNDQLEFSIPEEYWSVNQSVREELERPLMNRVSSAIDSNWQPQEYSSGLSWLKPRLWVPTYERISGADQFGLTMESVDVMSSQAYSLSIDHYLDRLWYEVNYNFKGFFPGFQIDLFNRPQLTALRIEQEDEEFIQTFLQQSRGISLKIPYRYRIESNARFSSVLIEPQYFVNQIRFLDPSSSSTAFSEFGTRHSIGLRTVLNLRLRQFSRDIQPNKGWVFFTESRYGLNSTELNITTDDFSFTGNLVDRKGFTGGLSTYFAPLMRWNQSMQVTARVITQTDLPVFNTASLYSESFSENPFPGANNVGLINTRYTIPLTFPDDGGLLLPVYLSNIYLVVFSQTAADLNSSDLIAGSRSVFGLGVRSRFRLSNLAFDVGFSVGWEPTRERITGHFGSF
jgi:hypothetical protein